MIINFTKMHSLGNDFIIIDAITQDIKLHSAYIKKIADRHVGIGCDQVILLEPPIHPTSDFYYKIYNANGKTAEQCINGARCAARFAFDSALVNSKTIIADCFAGRVAFTVEDNQTITAKIANINPNIKTISIKSNNINNSYQIYNLSIGNPHAIYLIDSKNPEQEQKLEHPKYNLLATEIANHDLFSQGINIGFAKLINSDIKLRVFERGTGETLSCGSNAIAAFLVAKHLNLVPNETKILFKLGALQIKLDGNHIYVTGSVNSVFTGKFKI